MLIIYEKLPNFCFCCGRVGHQYKDFVQYKSQPKDQFEYGPQLKALTKIKKMKQQNDQQSPKTNKSNYEGHIHTSPVTRQIEEGSN